ncbi:deoxyribodipyrimidine photo-lyase [Candidatus Saccharibacteria bacterium]|nr:deoxyribodipyrimidine photo-lyase [Candidatus Saccharibacteria bacterium]MBP7834804.1 deoxyribodipyrimidine photo-lyase [Candidatus Saccharibacteria bacterium]
MSNRSLALNTQSPQKGDCVIYFMSRDQRVYDNEALLAAQAKALLLKLPLIVCFVLEPKLGNRSREQALFMLDGILNIQNKLKQLNIGFIIKQGERLKVYNSLIKRLKPSTIYFDFSPLNGPRAIQKKVAHEKFCETIVVDSHNIIPAWILSDKEEFAAHTIRRKVHNKLSEYLTEPDKLIKHPFLGKYKSNCITQTDFSQFVQHYPATGVSFAYKSGEIEANKVLKDSIGNINEYAKYKNDPNFHAQTGLSPYLHFGQISSRRVVLDLLEHTNEQPLLLVEPKLVSIGDNPSKQDSINSLIEEIVVRKELADNFCFYNKNYNNLNGARQWAKDTLNKRATDTREFVYNIDSFENAATHDSAWNAAQNQMLKTGKMHGYMRMYWAKKILEWSESPQFAVDYAVYLNDKYSIDGGDPNGYTGIMWSIAGIHDRPWFDRPVFGTIRYMNPAGLNRKFNLAKYEKQWNSS